MFSVDNFYEFFKSKYGWQKHRVLPWAPKIHGSKELTDWTRWHTFDYNADPDQVHASFDIGGCLILHDQEPFWTGLHDIYYKKRNEELNDAFSSTDFPEWFLRFWPTCSWPIFCHSEKNSSDIQWIKDIGLIDCHYFYHGLISRDWFRHWKHHPNFYPRTDYQKRFLLYVRDTSGSREYRKKVKEDLYPQRSHILHDWDGKNVVSSDYSTKITPLDAEKSAIHLVAETVFEDNKIHLTEKIFKPIVMCQPFIVYAGPGALSYLRSYGFRTFSDIWDESYDLETDHDKRRAMISLLVNDLCNLSDEEFRVILNKCRDILEHNRRHFYSDDFENIMLKEMDSNLLAAYDQQRQLSITDPGGSYFYVLDRMINKGLEFNDETMRSWRVMNTGIRFRSLRSELETNHPTRWRQICSMYPWADTILR